MNLDEILRAYATSEGAVTAAVVLAVVLWVMRRTGLVKELQTKHEVAAVLPVAASYLLASLQSGHELKAALLNTALVVIGPMKWNSSALPAERKQAPPPSGPSRLWPASLLLVGALSLGGCHKVMPVLAEIGTASQLVSESLGAIAAAGDRWAEGNPEAAEKAKAVRKAVERTQRALRALQMLGEGARAYSKGDVAEAKRKLLKAYAEVYQLARELGLVKERVAKRSQCLQGCPVVKPPAEPVRDAVTPKELDELLSE